MPIKTPKKGKKINWKKIIRKKYQSCRALTWVTTNCPKKLQNTKIKRNVKERKNPKNNNKTVHIPTFISVTYIKRVLVHRWTDILEIIGLGFQQQQQCITAAFERAPWKAPLSRIREEHSPTLDVCASEWDKSRSRRRDGLHLPRAERAVVWMTDVCGGVCTKAGMGARRMGK